jgi:zinc transport system permease protein
MTIITDNWWLWPLINMLLAGLLAPLCGSLLVWRGAAYGADALAHITLLGASLALLLGLPHQFGMVVLATMLGVVIGKTKPEAPLAAESWIGAFSHTALALALVVLSMAPDVSTRLLTLLVGDIFTTTRNETIISAVLLGVAIIAVYFRNRWLLTVLHHELARSEGKNPTYVRIILMVGALVSLAWLATQSGTLLIAGLAIVPAIAARKTARSPSEMLIIASAIGLAAAAIGFALSFMIDTAPAPLSVVTASLIMLVLLCSGFKFR